MHQSGGYGFPVMALRNCEREVAPVKACARVLTEIFKKHFTWCIALASGGYPGSYEKGKVISGIEEAEKEKDIIVFHAGTKLNEKGNLVTNGGRVLGTSATGESLQEALDKAYSAISKISFEGMQYRKDIGKKSLN